MRYAGDAQQAHEFVLGGVDPALRVRQLARQLLRLADEKVGHRGAERRQVAIFEAARRRKPRAQCRQPRPGLIGQRFGHAQLFGEGVAAQADQCARLQAGTLHAALEAADLELGHAAFALVGREHGGDFRLGPGHPAIAAADQRQQVGKAALDLFQAVVEHLDVAVFAADAPAQVDRLKVDAQQRAAAPDLGEYLVDQVLTFGLHVDEGRRDEHANGGAGSLVHGSAAFQVGLVGHFWFWRGTPMLSNSERSASCACGPSWLGLEVVSRFSCSRSRRARG